MTCVELGGYHIVYNNWKIILEKDDTRKMFYFKAGKKVSYDFFRAKIYFQPFLV